MLDIKFIRENTDIVKKAAKNKGYDIDVDQLLKIDNERAKLLSETEKLRADQNKITKGLKGNPSKEQLENSKKLKDRIGKIIPKLRKIEADFNELMLLVPNIPSEKSPVGPDEISNEEIKTWGKIPKFDFTVRDHLDLGFRNNLIELERAVKTGGTRSYILKNELVILEQAVLRYGLDKIRKEGYEIMNVPVVVKEQALINSGFFPHGKEDIYQLDSDKYLVGTSEVSLVNYYSDETLQESELPKLLGAVSTCFRKEVGAYGKDTKGVFRVHQFNKVEQVVICKPDEGEKYFNFMLTLFEELMRELEVPYRLMEISTGDMGPKNHRQIDLDLWYPSENRYREIGSCSWLSDFQARRAKIKIRNDKGEKVTAHTLNCTVVPTPRILAAILENYQQKDGSIKIPKVLEKYTGFDRISNF